MLTTTQRKPADRTWTIRIAVPDDADLLPAVEQSAGERFRTLPDLAWLADGDNLPSESHRRYIGRRTEWVATGAQNELIGFLAAEAVGQDLHVWELAVRVARQGEGIGGVLLDVAAAHACAEGLRSITLTTFIAVPWNAPWYARRGFEVAGDDSRLARLLELEAASGLSGRCAMRRRTDAA